MKKLTAKNAARLEKLGATVTRIEPPIPPVPASPGVATIDTKPLETLLAAYGEAQLKILNSLCELKEASVHTQVVEPKQPMFPIEIEITEVTRSRDMISGCKLRLTAGRT